MKVKLIEREIVERDYGFDGINAIIEHSQHGRLLIRDAYGEAGLRGGCVRWEHGTAIKLKSDDTLIRLKQGRWNDDIALWDAVVDGYDASRPVLDWSGAAVQRVAQAAGV